MILVQDKMNISQVLQIIEQVLLRRKLNNIERFIVNASWLGKTYSEMAQESNYGNPHLKEVGSCLWRELSEVVGSRVTKKNLQIILPEFIDIYSQTKNVEPTAQPFIPGTALAANSPWYIIHSAVEKLAYDEIVKPGCLLRISAAEKMGKSSLLNRIIAYGRQLGYQMVVLDLAEADGEIFINLDRFLRWFCLNTSRLLGLTPDINEFWDEEIGSKVSCMLYFEHYILAGQREPLAIAINNLHLLFEYPKIAGDFLPMLRYWHEKARTAPLWQKLRLIITYSTEIYVPLKLHQSPFNVGLCLKLPSLSLEQTVVLANHYGIDCQKKRKFLQLIFSLVGGHPYLLSIAFYKLATKQITDAEIITTAPTITGIYSHYLRNRLAILKKEPELIAALQKILANPKGVVVEAIAGYKLQSMGLVTIEGNLARMSCQLYGRYFGQQLGLIGDKSELINLKKKNETGFVKNIDSLTKLPNQEYFLQYLHIQWQTWADNSICLSLILCDLDYFKFYNEAYGFLTGDACLALVSETIKECLKYQTSLLARYEGQEFAIVIPNCNCEQAVTIAENIRQEIKNLAISHNHSKVIRISERIVTVSLGLVSIKPTAEVTSAMLITAAQEALSQSKKQGRDRVTVSTTLNNDQ